MTSTPAEDFASLRGRLIDEILLWSSIAAVPGVLLSLASAPTLGWQPPTPAYFLPVGTLWLLRLTHRGIAYAARVHGLLAILWLATVISLAQLGPTAVSGVLAILFAFVAVLFLDGGRAGWLIAVNLLPLVLVGLAAMPSEVKTGLEAGFLAYFTKPFNVPTLLARIRDILEHAKSA